MIYKLTNPDLIPNKSIPLIEHDWREPVPALLKALISFYTYFMHQYDGKKEVDDFLLAQILTRIFDRTPNFDSETEANNFNDLVGYICGIVNYLFKTGGNIN